MELDILWPRRLNPNESVISSTDTNYHTIYIASVTVIASTLPHFLPKDQKLTEMWTQYVT